MGGGVRILGRRSGSSEGAERVTAGTGRAKELGEGGLEFRVEEGEVAAEASGEDRKKWRGRGGARRGVGDGAKRRGGARRGVGGGPRRGGRDRRSAGTREKRVAAELRPPFPSGRAAAASFLTGFPARQVGRVPRGLAREVPLHTAGVEMSL